VLAAGLSREALQLFEHRRFDHGSRQRLPVTGTVCRGFNWSSVVGSARVGMLSDAIARCADLAVYLVVDSLYLNALWMPNAERLKLLSHFPQKNHEVCAVSAFRRPLPRFRFSFFHGYHEALRFGRF
jgi:hypothetical protein